MAILLLFAGCQTIQPSGDQTQQTTQTGNGEIQSPNTITLPGDDEKSLPSEAPSNFPEENRSNPSEEGDLGAASDTDQQRLEEAYESQNSSLCQQIESKPLKESCLKNLSGTQGGADVTERDLETDAAYQEYGDTEEPEVNKEEQPAT